MKKLLAIADDALSLPDDTGMPIVGPEAFDESLVKLVLFEDGAILPDMWVFSSPHIRRHVEDARRNGVVSLLEAAIRRGLVELVFRVPSDETLVRAVRTLQDQGIEYIDYPQAERFARRLDAVLETRWRAAIRPWPKTLGAVDYERVLVDVLQREESPLLVLGAAYAGDPLKDWNDTAPFRQGCIDLARDRSSRLVGGGVRRAELLRAVKEHLGLASDSSSSVHALLPRMEPGARRAVRLFGDWMNACYYVARADGFGAARHFPRVDPASDVVLPALATRARPGGPTGETFHVTVPFPAFAALARVPGDLLLDVRERHLLYREAVAAWQAEPTLKHADALHAHLLAYAKDVIALSLRYGPPSPARLDVRLAPDRSGVMDALWGVGRVMGDEAAERSIGLPLPSFVSESVRLGTTCYRQVRDVSTLPLEYRTEVSLAPAYPM